MWYITEDEYLRLSKLFGRDFQETGLGATLVIGLPKVYLVHVTAVASTLNSLTGQFHIFLLVLLHSGQ